MALACAELASSLGPSQVAVTELGVALQLYLPYVMAASYGAPPPDRPPAPRPAPGGGWLAADLGSPGDRDLFDTLLSTLPDSATAADVAEAAQQWRLAVCEYVSRGLPTAGPVGPGSLPLRPRFAAGGRVPPPTRHPPEADAPAPHPHPLAGVSPPTRHPPEADAPAPHPHPLAGVVVMDLTAMWAGPLATWLLQSLGATVYKVEAECRLDGTRALGGGGIYPGGTQRRPGEDSALWNALNRGKHRLDLDLRNETDRSNFVERAASADVIVDSFSPRVLPNFGLDPASLAGLALSMPAFPAGPHRDWVAYGTGVHALTGLGETDDGSFAAPAFAYPDPLAGFTGALAVVAGLAGRLSGSNEVSLVSATEPLLTFGGRLCSDEPPGRQLLEAGIDAGEFRCMEVVGTVLAHPVGPFKVLPTCRSK